MLSLFIFVNTSKKGNAVEASYVKVILGCVLLAFLKNCSNLSMPYHEDVINVSVINSRLM